MGFWKVVDLLDLFPNVLITFCWYFSTSGQCFFFLGDNLNWDASAASLGSFIFCPGIQFLGCLSWLSLLGSPLPLHMVL